jgi:LacI family transcriptional regulator
VGDRPLVLQALNEMGSAYVRMAPYTDVDSAPQVYMDDRLAAYEMTAHLLKLGHRDIGFIVGHPDHGSSYLRRDGFLAAMREQGCTVPAERIVQGQFSFQSGFDCAGELLGGRTRPTAIFASNDDMALGVLAVAHRKGLSVPADLSVAGFDDTPAATTTAPQLTTVRQPIFGMAKAAADMLISGEGDMGRGGRPPARLLPFEIIVRESTAPPGGLGAGSIPASASS